MPLLDADTRLARRIRRDTVERGRDVNSVLEQVLPIICDLLSSTEKYTFYLVASYCGTHIFHDAIAFVRFNTGILSSFL